MMKKNYFVSVSVFVLFLMLSSTSLAQTAYQSEKDSLLNLIQSLTGADKLNAYYELMTSVYHNEENMDSVQAHFNDYIREAQNQNNIKDEGMVYVNLLAAYCNREQMKNAIRQAPRILEFLEENKLWEYYYQAYAIYLEACFFDRQYKKTIDKAKELYEFAKKQNNSNGISAAFYSMALVYNKTGREDEAEEYFRKCIETQLKSDKKIPLFGQSYYFLFEIVSRKKRSDEALLLIEEWKRAINDYETQKKLINPIARGQIYAAYAHIYLDKGLLSEAEAYCDSSLMCYSDPSHSANIAFLKASILSSRKEYPQALKLLDEACNTLSGYNEWEVTVEIMKEKIRILLAGEDNEEALSLFETIIARKDSLVNMEFHSQLDELRTQYEVDKLTASRKITRLQLFIALSVCALLLIALGIYFAYSCRLKQKNKSLFEQIQELMRAEKAVEEQLQKTPQEQLSREMQLFKKLGEVMQSEKLFTASDLSRKSLADRLNTNETYLADAIREGSGLTFSAYLSELRLQYSLFLLTEQSDMTLDAVAFESGHGSYSPFFKAFTKKYGITPSEYRKISKTK